MKILTTFIFLTLTIKVVAQDSSLKETPYYINALKDTFEFQNIPNIKTIEDITQLGNIEIIDTIDDPFGIIFEKEYLSYFLALKNDNNWEYWQLPSFGNLVRKENSKNVIEVINLGNQKSRGLILTTEVSNGHFNISGGFAVYEQYMLIYDLDKKKLALDLMKLHDYEVAARIFKNKDTPIVNPNFYNDSILNTFDCYHYQTLEYYSCGYSISDTIFSLNCECKIRSSEGDCKIELSETAKITFNSKFTRIYEIQSDKFVLKIQ